MHYSGLAFFFFFNEAEEKEEKNGGLEKKQETLLRRVWHTCVISVSRDTENGHIHSRSESHPESHPTR